MSYGDPLIRAALSLLKQAGLTATPTKASHHKARVLRQEDGALVRVRYCPFRRLPVIADVEKLKDRKALAKAWERMFAETEHFLCIAPRGDGSSDSDGFLIPSELLAQYVLYRLERGETDLSPRMDDEQWASFLIGSTPLEVPVRAAEQDADHRETEPTDNPVIAKLEEALRAMEQLPAVAGYRALLQAREAARGG